ncbi:hypothetical protein BaRGS_00019490, partial [Batillaria attramentaria]
MMRRGFLMADVLGLLPLLHIISASLCQDFFSPTRHRFGDQTSRGRVLKKPRADKKERKRKRRDAGRNGF